MFRLLVLSVLTLLMSGAVMQFKPPGEKQRIAAIGPIDDLPKTLRRAFTPGEDFEPISRPGPSDWLANRPEPGQTFEQFVCSKPHKPDKKRNKLYLLPLGEFAKDRSPPLDSLRDFAAAFFMMDVEVPPVVRLDGSGITSRQNPFTGNMQLLTGDILKLLRKKLPDDAYALLGITMVDLYPDPAWNFVFGQASLRDRVGVYSFARYDPRFYGEEDGAPSRSEGPAGPRPGGGLTPDSQKLMLRRSCKVLAHETAHMFGVQHCIYFHCLMNGSNHLAESDARPLHLCPVDLRKLHHSIGFDVIARYRRLRDFCKRTGLSDEERWLSKRLEYLENP
jgi:archaemetzincin